MSQQSPQKQVYYDIQPKTVGLAECRCHHDCILSDFRVAEFVLATDLIVQQDGSAFGCYLNSSGFRPVRAYHYMWHPNMASAY